MHYNAEIKTLTFRAVGVLILNLDLELVSFSIEDSGTGAETAENNSAVNWNILEKMKLNFRKLPVYLRLCQAQNRIF